MYTPSKSIELALKTWYPEEHSLHYALTHPIRKLVGEIGELIDGDAKGIYKVEFIPDYKFTKDQFLAELGDISYYLRILAYNCKFNPEDEVKPIYFDDKRLETVEYCLSEMAYYAACIQRRYFKYKLYNIDIRDEMKPKIIIIYNYLIAILELKKYTWDDLILMNRKKLSNNKHGWKEIE